MVEILFSFCSGMLDSIGDNVAYIWHRFYGFVITTKEGIQTETLPWLIALSILLLVTMNLLFFKLRRAR